jgi:CRP-like cAMP-binding protein
MTQMTGNPMEQLVKPLQNILLFAGLSEESLLELAEKLVPLELEENEILFKKGDPGNALYIIQQGWVKAFAENTRGEEVVLNEFGPGESFGEMSLIDGRPRSASIQAMDDTLLLILRRENFLEMLASHPTFALELLRDISAKLRFAATYIQKVTEWSQYIAEGNYMDAMREIENAQSLVEEAELTDEDRARSFLAAIFQMIEGVKKREEALQLQVQRLRIKIDEQRRATDVAEITESEYFQSLQKRAKELREKVKGTNS